MIKKINTDQLKPGMFIHDLNCGWIDHPFLTNSFQVKNDASIRKIIEHGIREVYIDTDRGLDDAHAPTKEEVNNEITSGILKVVEEVRKDPPRIPLKEELVRAKVIQKEAKETIENIMHEVRFGKQIEKEKVDHVVEKMVHSIFRNQSALLSLSRIRKVDEYTYMHSMSVSVLMISFGKYLGYDEALLREIGFGAMLHDIGKMRVPQDILCSTRKLTPEEFETMKKHVSFGRSLLEQSPGIPETAIKVSVEHHERIDGSGYPRGLAGDEISEFGRAASITDVYDAMTSQRCYQKQFQPTEVLRRLYEWSKYHFDSTLVQQFIRCVGIYPVGSTVRLKSGLIGIVIKHGEQNPLQPVVRAIYDAKKERYLTIPQDIDLSTSTGNGGADRVINYEVPEKWNIRPEMYM